MIRLAILLLALCIFWLAAVGGAQAGPFGPGKGGARAAQTDSNATTDRARPPSEAATGIGSGFLGQCLQAVTLLQKRIKSSMAGYARNLRERPLGASFWSFLGLALLYGALHAVGPGHGKTVVSAYCLGRPGGPFRAMLMGIVLSATHVGSATLVVGAAYLVFSGSQSGFQNAGIRLEQASYALIALLGLGIFAQTLRRMRRGPEPERLPNASEDPRHMLLTAFATGLVPCPGATLILIFTINLHILWTGLLSMLFLAVGMGLTTGLFGVAACGARSATFRSLRALDPRRMALLHALLSLCAATIIFLFGALLLLDALG